MERYRDHSVNRQAVKALVAVYGQNEAAKISGLPLGTVKSWCYRFKWRKAAVLPRATGINGNIPQKDTTDVLLEALQKHKEETIFNLAGYTAKAAKAALKLNDPLKAASQVRDVSQVFKNIFPPEEGGELIEGAILVGGMKVLDNPQEMLANVRERVSDQGPKGD